MPTPAQIPGAQTAENEAANAAPQTSSAGAQTTAPRRVRIAMVGAGIYPRDAHLPALARLQDRFEFAAIFSRSEPSARALAEHWHSLTAAAGHEAGANSPSSQSTPELFTDLAALFARDDIDSGRHRPSHPRPGSGSGPGFSRRQTCSQREAHRPHARRGAVIDRPAPPASGVCVDGGRKLAL